MTDAAQAGALILIVEDDAMIAEFVTDTLESADYRVDWAKNGLEALERLTQAQPALILLDLGLPLLDGLGVLAELKLRRAADPSSPPRLPIVIMTGRDSAADIRKAASLGATGHLAKPFSVSLLLSRVVEQLSKPGP